MSEIVPSNAEERQLSMVSWIASGFLFGIVPLIIWLIKKDQSKFVAYHGLASLFFSLIGALVASVSCGIGYIATIVIGIMWGMKANKGEMAEMPLISGWAKSASGLK